MAGSRKGIPNKVTQSVREAIAEFATANVAHIGEWLNDIPDPAKRLDLYLRALEYHIPKLGRTEHTGEGGGPVKHSVSVDFVGTNPRSV
jgi:hypothetical protein